jgi:mannosyltransferase
MIPTAHDTIPTREAADELPVRKRMVTLGVILLAALIARLIHLDRGMWIDELKTWGVSRFTWDAMLTNRFEQGHLPLYFALMRLWTPIAGAHAWALRLPCVALGVWGVNMAFSLLGLQL